MKKTAILGLTALSLCGVCALRAQDTAKITSYIQGLKYDPRRLLAIKEAGSTDAVPPERNPQDDGSLVICTTTKQTLDGELSEVTLMSPSVTAVFPGALLKANAHLADGKPDLISLPQGPLTLSIDLPNLGGDSSVLVNAPTRSTVQAGIDKMLKAWFKDGDNVQAARQSLETRKAYNSEQIALSLGVRAKWAGKNTFQLDNNLGNKVKRSTCIALYKQVYYTVSVDPPARPGEAFGANVSLDDVQHVADRDNPPAYVKSVDYGRIIMIRMDTQSSETEADLTSALKYATAGGTARINADLEAKYENITKNSTFTVVTLGGNAAEATQVMEGSKQASDSLFKLIQGSAQFNKKNPAYPIAYTVDFLKDNSVASMAYTTQYMQTDCKTMESGFVKVENGAAVIGSFQVWWTEKDEKGQPAKKFWESQRVTQGYKHTIQMAPDATQVRVHGEWYNGSSWREVFDESIKGPNDKNYRMKGTAFSVGWELK